MMKTAAILLFVAFFFCAVPAGAEDAGAPKEVLFFFSQSCHSCLEVKQDILPAFEERCAGKVRIVYKDIEELENYTQLIALLERYTADAQFRVPVVFYDGTLVSGVIQIRQKLGEIMRGEVSSSSGEGIPEQIDLMERFQRFRPVAVAVAGLADGINPCAFTVIVFFISFLSMHGYRKRELLCIGGAFMIAVFLTYLLIGLGVFNFLYRLRGFWAVTRFINQSVGVLSIVLGFLTVYDIIAYRRSRKTDGMVLQLPAAVKQRIRSVIGYFYRPQGAGARPEKPGLWKLALSALVTGFLISLLEAVCTGQLYLPTIIFVFKTSHLKLQALGYLLLYNIMFVVPLGFIFVLALSGATSDQAGRFLRKHLIAVKAALGVIFFGLGIFLFMR